MDLHQVIYSICSVFVAAPTLCVRAQISYLVNVTMCAALFCTSCRWFKRTLGSPYRIALQ